MGSIHGMDAQTACNEVSSQILVDDTVTPMNTKYTITRIKGKIYLRSMIMIYGELRYDHVWTKNLRRDTETNEPSHD